MEYIVFIAIICLIFVYSIIRSVWDEKRREQKFIKSLYTEYGKKTDKNYPEGRLKKMASFYEKGNGEFIVDDITWNDLDLDRVFTRMDYTYSSLGEEMLYHILRQPVMDESELLKREKLITYFMENADDRVRLQTLFAKIGRTGKYSIYEYLEYLDNLEERKNTKHYVVLAGLALSLIACFFSVLIGMPVFFVLLAYNLLAYFKEKAEIEPYITTFSYILRVLKMESMFAKLNISAIEAEVLSMDDCRKKFGKFCRGAFLLMNDNVLDGNPADVLMDYVRMCLHLNLIKFNTMLSECKKYKKDIVYMIETMGYIESMLSVGAYRVSTNEWCIPAFDANQTELLTKDIAHPLLEKPVTNSLKINKGMLLTGSNASGKSTFLKTVALAQIMAQSVHTVCAKSYTTMFYRVLSSMSLRDSLENSDSYFIVEIKALKRIIDSNKPGQVPVMCFVDEVLRGTNTVERIAAASQILQQIYEDGSFCFAATHDIELTYLLEEDYTNYHFEESIEQNDVKFNYQLKEGRAVSKNAIKLLAVLGYNQKIIEKAEKRAQHFLNNGEWI